ncbi:TIGR02281 family clan AA aspartic protease [Agaribacterium sp. ZY112]|uniref:retropepsin-like aspartic protease family protein n=1 Tax=Agaribacterium sp. ZY112 TaxID=3233574 RepID=UPI003523AC70
MTFLSLLLIAVPSFADIEVIAKGLMDGRAVLTINGRQQVLKVGQSSDEGVTLISADTERALILLDGQERELLLSQQIGGSYSQVAATVVRLSSKDNGHYFGSAFIKGRNVPFMVDTGASIVAMNSHIAESLGLRYKDAPQIRISTAQGNTNAYELNLASVSVGGIVVKQVRAAVFEGDFPRHVLLGNSFLSQVDMKVEQGVLILQSR